MTIWTAKNDKLMFIFIDILSSKIVVKNTYLMICSKKFQILIDEQPNFSYEKKCGVGI